MADVNRGNRPLSPFMIGQYYRPQMTSMSSIMVRITGLITLGVAVLLAIWLLAAASSDEAFALVDGLLLSILGNLVLFIGSWAIWYHMLGRLRHVIWDFGYCLDVRTSEYMGWGMFIGATLLALFTAIAI
ncbi:succinate dehydrogenase, cytochrome b556 subunit [Ponticoccus alexandrii]|jgi:succinate dehydrogenase / fumarate reductase cytochrome b subunit|uniref:Succinate dehydrogenase cytochrome b556 subunit n=1 Tax=Ponticoccus alexandrii TaxID=1943633 RepID=A0ABX7F584_9RHOB|nr:succinate dehydrogenase, cytochrome b556 subunit [Ponticoccus alexandrii]ETA49845.1 succinate dehydrogenase [Rhodobacteraceae bacterium PD-2]QRF65700.1 succinate dehydrogenase, cytochrome b556 subunit [Ponticoccus alexandrii]